MPVDREEFAAKYWSARPLLAPSHTLPAPFTDLLSPADAEELLGERGVRQPFVALVQDGDAVAGWTRTATAGNRRLTDLADPDRVRTRYAEGATIVLNALHRIHPPIARFCRTLAAELGHPTQCNAYLTPGGHARGFRYHHDTHDVFVLQVDGRKRWIVHEPVLPLPLPAQSRSGDHLVREGAEPLLDVVLGPGDALYLPRGFVHAAVTTEDSSQHLTVGVLSTTWYDVLTDALGLAADELDFRAALPIRPGDADLDLAGFLARAARWLGDVDPDRLGQRVAERLARAEPPEPLGVLGQPAALAALTADTPVRPRRGLTTRLSDEDGQLTLHLPDRTITFPGHVAHALRTALAGPATAAGLAEAEVTAEDAVVLLRRLVREGVLVPA